MNAARTFCQKATDSAPHSEERTGYCKADIEENSRCVCKAFGFLQAELLSTPGEDQLCFGIGFLQEERTPYEEFPRSPLSKSR